MVKNYVKNRGDLRISDVTIKMFHPYAEGGEVLVQNRSSVGVHYGKSL